MIFFYGAGARVLNEIHLPEERPEGAGEEGVVLAAMSRYIHLFWIPLISIGKKVVAIDVLTEEEIKKRNFTKRMKEEAAVLKETSRVPFRHFSGLAIGLLVVLGFQIKSFAAEKQLAKSLKDPKVGDVYFMNDEGTEFPYYFARNIAMVEDTIWVQLANSSYDIEQGLKDEYADKVHLTPGYFNDTIIYNFNQHLIDSLYDVGAIVDLKRDPSFSFQSTLQQPIDSTDLEE